jgi:hypothetical protein
MNPESIQLTLNSRTSIFVNSANVTNRSIIQVQLDRDSIPVPEGYKCSVSVISAEILNGIRQVDETTYQTIIATTDSNYPLNRGTVGFTVTTTLRIPIGNAYTPTTLATAINGKTFTLNGIVRTFIASQVANNITVSAGAGVFLFTDKPIPIIGLYPAYKSFLFGSSLAAVSPPLLQQKFLQITSSFKTTRNQPLCKIPINAPFNSYILFSPTIPFPVRINEEVINTFQIYLLNEDGIQVNNNSNDWSVTLQFDFIPKTKKPELTIDE